MKRRVLISLGILAAVSLAPAARAFSQQKTQIIVDDRKVKKIEEAGAFLGIYMEELDDESRKERDYPKSSGVLVTQVIAGSPAEKAGIEEDDIIYLFAGETVDGGRMLGELVSSRKPGDSVEIVLYRGGKKKTVDVALAEKKKSYVTIDIDEDSDHPLWVMNKLGEPGMALLYGGKGGEWSLLANRVVLGVSLHELSDDLAPYFDVKAGEGVLVLDVFEDTPAAEAGLKDGDVIVEVAGAKIARNEDVVDALEDADEDTVVTVTVVRGGKKLDIPVKTEHDGVYSVGMLHPAYGKALKNYRYRIRAPEMEAIRIQDVEGQELAEKMKQLEKQIEELQRRLREMEKSD